MKKLILLLFISFVYLVANFTVSFAGGQAFIIKNGVKTKLSIGDVVRINDAIQTGRRSFVALKADDGSAYKIYANSFLRIEKYINNNQKRVKTFNLFRGKMFSFISKVFRKSDVKILTQNGVIAVRGTSFLLENTVDKFDVYLLEGKLEVLDKSYNLLTLINAGQFASKSRGVDEVEVRQLNREEMKDINRDVEVKQFSPSLNIEEVEERGEGREVKEGGEIISLEKEEINGREEKFFLEEDVRQEFLNQESLKQGAIITVSEVDIMLENNEVVVIDNLEAGKTPQGRRLVQKYERVGNTIQVGSVYLNNKGTHLLDLKIEYDNLPTYQQLLEESNVKVIRSVLRLESLPSKLYSDRSSSFEYINNGDGNPVIVYGYNGKTSTYSNPIEDETISSEYLFFDQWEGAAKYVFPEKLTFYNQVDEDVKTVLVDIIKDANEEDAYYITEFDLDYSYYYQVDGVLVKGDLDQVSPTRDVNNSKINFKYKKGFVQKNYMEDVFDFIDIGSIPSLNAINLYERFQNNYYTLGYLFDPIEIVTLLVQDEYTIIEVDTGDSSLEVNPDK